MSDDEAVEPPRPLPDFGIYVAPFNGPAIDITLAVMDVYDIAINSMDFGSGFLSTEEVGHIRALGRAIGAEHFDYQSDKCLVCGHLKGSHYSTRKNCARIGCDCKGFINGEVTP